MLSPFKKTSEKTGVRLRSMDDGRVQRSMTLRGRRREWDAVRSFRYHRGGRFMFNSLGRSELRDLLVKGTAEYNDRYGVIPEFGRGVEEWTPDFLEPVFGGEVTAAKKVKYEEKEVEEERGEDNEETSCVPVKLRIKSELLNKPQVDKLNKDEEEEEEKKEKKEEEKKQTLDHLKTVDHSKVPGGVEGVVETGGKTDGFEESTEKKEDKKEDENKQEEVHSGENNVEKGDEEKKGGKFEQWKKTCLKRTFAEIHDDERVDKEPCRLFEELTLLSPAASSSSSASLGGEKCETTKKEEEEDEMKWQVEMTKDAKSPSTLSQKKIDSKERVQSWGPLTNSYESASELSIDSTATEIYNMDNDSAFNMKAMLIHDMWALKFDILMRHSAGDDDDTGLLALLPLSIDDEVFECPPRLLMYQRHFAELYQRLFEEKSGGKKNTVHK